MSAILLFYAGITVIGTGLARLGQIGDKSPVVMSLFTGVLGLILNIVSISAGIVQGQETTAFMTAGTSLLFSFTFLYVAINTIFDLDFRLFGYFSLFVAINAVYLSYLSWQATDWRFAVIWFLWAILWLGSFIEINLKKSLGKPLSYLYLFEGVVTLWLPALLMFTGKW